MADISWIDKVYKEIGGNDSNQDVKDWLSTGYLPLNYCMSGRYDGGIPVGRITEVFGAESSGKTLMATMAMIETQRRGGLALMLDYEHAFSLRRAINLGLSTDKERWIFKQPESAEKGFAIIEFIANEVRKADTDKFITVVVDSVASMTTEEELKAGFEDVNMKTRLSLAAVLSSSLKLLSSLVNNTNITLLFLNQTRDNPGIMFGDKKKTAGGNALKFYCSTRVKLSKVGKLKDGDAVIGETVHAEVIKNKVFEPFRSCEFQSCFKEGINLLASHIDALKELGKLGDKKGYVVFRDKSWREKELVETARNDSEVYSELLQLFSD